MGVLLAAGDGDSEQGVLVPAVGPEPLRGTARVVVVVLRSCA